MAELSVDIERLYSEIGPGIWHYLRRRVVDALAAEELLQETFLAAVERPAALAAANSRRAWLFGIARNLVREHARTVARRHTVGLAQEPAASATPDDDPRLETMRRAIKSLPDRQREVLALRLREDLSYAEIAEALEVPVGTVRSRIHHAVAALRNLLATADPPTGPKSSATTASPSATETETEP